jgi:hypothetical protein
MKRGLDYLLSGCVVGASLFSMGCQQKIMIPDRVTTHVLDKDKQPVFSIYRIDQDAKFIFESYINHAMLSDFRKALPDILKIVDEDDDYRIGHHEAYEAINVFRPAMKEIIKELTKSREEYAAKLEPRPERVFVDIKNGPKVIKANLAGE